jgi:hypothetical protein
MIANETHEKFESGRVLPSDPFASSECLVGGNLLYINREGARYVLREGNRLLAETIKAQSLADIAGLLRPGTIIQWNIRP